MPLSEPSVAIAVSAPHRDAAFAGAREIIDEIKARVSDLEERGGRMGAGDGAAPGDLRARCPPSMSSRRRSTRRMRSRWRRRGGRSTSSGPRCSRAPAAARDLVARARELLAELERPSLRRVINATGVIVHTNLGRAPLPAAARDAVARACDGYCNLELDLASGERGSRHAHVEALIRELTGAEAALVVNNGAGAVLLAAASLGGAGRDVIVSRGQLVEIGGGFRIPEVVAQSGARLVEVGTTNRTRLTDYERALDQGGDRSARSSGCTRRTSARSGSCRTSRSRPCAGWARL